MFATNNHLSLLFCIKARQQKELHQCDMHDFSFPCSHWLNISLTDTIEQLPNYAILDKYTEICRRSPAMEKTELLQWTEADGAWLTHEILCLHLTCAIIFYYILQSTRVFLPCSPSWLCIILQPIFPLVHICVGQLTHSRFCWTCCRVVSLSVAFLGSSSASYSENRRYSWLESEQEVFFFLCLDLCLTSIVWGAFTTCYYRKVLSKRPLVFGWLWLKNRGCAFFGAGGSLCILLDSWPDPV